MLQPDPTRIPQRAETVILADGRRFVVSSAATDLRGWWFTATSLDGGSTLQGNLRLEWDPQASAWRPRAARTGLSRPPALGRTRRLKQPD